MKEQLSEAFRRLFRGETTFDFVGRWQRWLMISGIVFVVGWAALGIRGGLNFSLEFTGGTQWQVPTHASVAQTRNAIGSVNPNLRQATITRVTNHLTHQDEISVQASANKTANGAEVGDVSAALAKMASTVDHSNVSAGEVTLNDIGPSWGSTITNKAIEGVIIFLIAFGIYIWIRFEAKMSIAALVALVHDILITVGIYALSGFQVSPSTVVAFLTILGYSLYDTIVVFDKIEENTKGLASAGRLSYSDMVNLSENQVLARSLNTSIVAILPIFAILVIGSWILGASALDNFGLALFIGLTSGAYSSLFIASPVLALLKEREPRYAHIRERLAKKADAHRMTPAEAAIAGASRSGGGRTAAAGSGARTSRAGSGRSGAGVGSRLARAGVGSRRGGGEAGDVSEPEDGDADQGSGRTAGRTQGASRTRGAASPSQVAKSAEPAASADRVPRRSAPPPRPRKKRRR